MDHADPLLDRLLLHPRQAPAASAVPEPPALPAGAHLQSSRTPAPRLAGGFAVLGLRATGPSPFRDRLVEVAVVLLDPTGAAVREWSTLVDPQRPGAGGPRSPLGARRAPVFAGVAGELAALLSGRVLVAHSAARAVPLLRAELARAGASVPLGPTWCTLQAAWSARPDLPRWRLADCCAASGVPHDGAPWALGDARATAGLLRGHLDGPGQLRDPTLARLVARAASIPWPSVPGPRSVPVPREHPPARPPAAPLAVLGDAVRLDDAGLPLPAAAGYAELLAELLAAGPVTAEVASALADCAEGADLTGAQARATSRGVLLALARAAGDGAGAAEREVLLASATALGVDAGAVLTVLEAAPAGPAPAVVDLREADTRTAPVTVSRSGAR